MDLLDQIKDKASTEDLADLDVAISAKAVSLAAFQKAPGPDTKESLDAAGEFYQQTIEQLQGKYLQEATAAPEGERFANRKQALNWLNAQGYKVSQDKFYKDCKAGFPVIHRDKSISKFQVLQYGQQLDVKNRAGSELTEQDVKRTGAETRKAVASADREEMRRDAERRELSSEWIKTEDAVFNECARLSDLRDSFRYHIVKALPALILAAGGKIDRAPELIDLCEQLVIDRACNDVAQTARGDAEIEFDEVAE